MVRTRALGEFAVEVTMCDPARRNALGPQLLAELRAALTDVAPTCRVLVLRAEPGASSWSAGYDIGQLPASIDDVHDWTNPLEEFVRFVRSRPFPVIAAVEGGVWGGACDLALSCDLVIAVRSATFAITPGRLGVPYETTGIARMLAVLPDHLVREMYFTADPIGAPLLAQHGVVNRLVEHGADLEEAVTALTGSIASRAPLTIRSIKAELGALTDAWADAASSARLADLRRAAWASADYVEGVRAFTERRPPRFTGR